MKQQYIPLNLVYAADNDRKHFDQSKIERLALSLAKSGLLSPIVVRPVDGRFELVAGERRTRAHFYYNDMVDCGEWESSPKLRPHMILAKIAANMTDDEAEEIMLIENVQREDLNPIDEAHAYKKRLDNRWSKARLVKVTGKSYALINSRLLLLDLHPDIQDLVRHGNLPIGTAEEMAPLTLDRQLLVIRWLNSQVNYAPSRKHVKRYVNELLEQQQQDALFDFSSFFVSAAVEAAEGDNKRLSDMLPEVDGLPRMSKRSGSIGVVIDQYIADLLEMGKHNEAAVIMHLWRNLMKSNYAQVKPWDSKALVAMSMQQEA